ncbi:MAG: VTT domain-containing protein [Holophagales bacterium]|nr:VTT domain-containing protein [Holophagales bacterium]
MSRESSDPRAQSGDPRSAPPASRSGPSKATTLRLAFVLFLMVSGLLLVTLTPMGEYFEKERIVTLFEDLRGRWWAPVVLLSAFCVAGSLGIPASPFVLAGGVVFGPVYGTFYNITGLLAGAMAGFYVAKGLGRRAVVELAGPKLKRAELIFAKRGFWPLVQVRFLPIPFSVVSYAAALAGLGAGTYLLTSALGLIPATVAHTYFAPRLVLETLDGQKPFGLLLAYASVLGLLNVLAGWPQIQSALRRRRRYRELLEKRHALGRHKGR